MAECALDVRGGIAVVVEFIHRLKHAVFDIRVDDLHICEILHVIRADRGIALQRVLARQHLRRELIAVDEIDLIFFVHLFEFHADSSQRRKPVSGSLALPPRVRTRPIPVRYAVRPASIA